MNQTIVNLFGNRGNQRLWLLLSLAWLLIAGWYFWKDLPQHKPVDASEFVSDLCKAGEQARHQRGRGERLSTMLEGVAANAERAYRSNSAWHNG